jgi:hypothetical protein
MYRCTYDSCTRAFKEKGNLKIHIRTHVKNEYKVRPEKGLINAHMIIA